MIRDLAKYFSRKPEQAQSASMVAGLYMHPDHLKLVVLKTSPLQVVKVETLLLQDNVSFIEQCLGLVAELPAKTELCLILSSDRYQIVQVDKPAVQSAELLMALQFSVRELVNTPLEDVLLDYMDLPEQTQQGSAKVQVVVTSLSSLKGLCEELTAQKIKLTNIQPEEWLARNLLPKTDGALMLLTHQPTQEINLQIIRDQNILFSRKLRGFNRINQYDLSELQQGMLDNLLLEVQRSLDYYEGQLKQSPVREIYIQINNNALPGIIGYFTANGFSQVKALDLQTLMPKLSQAEREDYWLTLAGALELVTNRSDVP
jgi:MSHA biogenesis protein MshI